MDINDALILAGALCVVAAVAVLAGAWCALMLLGGLMMATGVWRGR